jgi:hypothetical protein
MDEFRNEQEEAASGSSFAEAQGSHETAFDAAAAFIQRDNETSDLIARGRESDTFFRQQELVLNWAREAGLIVPDHVFEQLTLVSNTTSEHEVRYRELDDCAVKRTWAGNFGQIPAIEGNGMDRKPATRRQYLHRMRLQNAVFESTFLLEGVSQSDKPSMIIGQPSGQPSFVVSQKWVEPHDPNDSAPTESELESFMIDNGFRRIPASYFGWWRPTDGVVALDAKRDNFVRSPQGVIPIDLQMWQFHLEQLADINLKPDNVIVF